MLRREVAVYRDLDVLAPWRPQMYENGAAGEWVWLLLEDLTHDGHVPPWDDAALEYSGDEILFTSEVIMNRSEVYPRVPGDVSNGNTIETLLPEQPLGHIENP